jgi:two-component system sensor histidine kinase/response regulator
LKFIHPDDVSFGAKALFEGFKKGNGEGELRFKHKNGHWIWIEAKGQTFMDSDGNLKAIIISRDVSERKLNEQKIQESERKFRQLYNQLSFYKDLFAHDIFNVLHIVRSSTELLSLQLSNQKTKIIEDLSKMIEKQIERGTKLMSNAFILSEIEESHISIKNLKLCEVLEDSIEYVKKAYKEWVSGFQL